MQPVHSTDIDTQMSTPKRFPSQSFAPFFDTTVLTRVPAWAACWASTVCQARVIPILSTRGITFPQVVVVAADMCCGRMYSPEWVVFPKFKSIQSLANQNLHATYQFSSRLQKFYATKARQKIFAKIRPCVAGGSNRWRPKNARVAQSRQSAQPILLPNHVEQNLCIALRSVPVGEGWYQVWNESLRLWDSWLELDNLHRYGHLHLESKCHSSQSPISMFIPKLLLRLLWFFRRTAALFRQIRTFPQLFRFCSDLGNSDKLWGIQCWRVADGKDESW